MKVELHVEELVLHGVVSGSREAVAASVARELERLLKERGVPEAWRQGGTLPRVQGTPARLSPGAPAGQVGAAVARSIYGGMTDADMNPLVEV